MERLPLLYHGEGSERQTCRVSGRTPHRLDDLHRVLLLEKGTPVYRFDEWAGYGYITWTNGPGLALAGLLARFGLVCCGRTKGRWSCALGFFSLR